MHGVLMNFQGGVESRPIILVLYGRTHTLVSNGCTPAKIRCFCAVSWDGNVQSAAMSPGTVICKLTACWRRFVLFVSFVSFVSLRLCGLFVHVRACPQTRLRRFWNQCIASCIHLHRRMGRNVLRKFQLHGHLMQRGYPVWMWLSGLLRLGRCGLVAGRRRIRIMFRPDSLRDMSVVCRSLRFQLPMG